MGIDQLPRQISKSVAEVNHVKVILAKMPICGFYIIQNACLTNTPVTEQRTSKQVYYHAFFPNGIFIKRLMCYWFDGLLDYT